MCRGCFHASKARFFNSLLMLALAKLDEFKNAQAYRALETQIRDLKDQQHMLSKRWRELTAGFSES
jgi:hypothetical protein